MPQNFRPTVSLAFLYVHGKKSSTNGHKVYNVPDLDADFDSGREN